jgi:hypothetical protein
MKFKISIVIIFITLAPVFSQEEGLNKDLEVSTNLITNNNASYYKAYFTEIRLNSNWVFRQEMQTRVGADYTVVEFPLLFKYNAAKNINFVVGPKIDLYKDHLGIINQASVYATFGIEYDVSESVLLEAKFNYRLTNEIPIKTDYTFGSKASFTLGSKVKF